MEVKDIKKRLKEIYKEVDDLQYETKNADTVDQICTVLNELEFLIWRFRKTR